MTVEREVYGSSFRASTGVPWCAASRPRHILGGGRRASPDGCVIPARLNNAAAPIRVLEQTPHSMFWDYDALGYIAMGFATSFAAQVLSRSDFERWVRWSLYANAIVTPLIALERNESHPCVRLRENADSAARSKD